MKEPPRKYFFIQAFARPIFVDTVSDNVLEEDTAAERAADMWRKVSPYHRRMTSHAYLIYAEVDDDGIIDRDHAEIVITFK